MRQTDFHRARKTRKTGSENFFHHCNVLRDDGMSYLLTVQAGGGGKGT